MARSDDTSENKVFGGLNAANTNGIDPKFICQLCKLVLISPWQLRCCGERFCKYCFLNILPDITPFTCPLCQANQPRKEGFFDRGAERELMEIVLDCFTCKWQGSYRDYLIHLQDQHANLKCSDCHKHFFAINLLQEHRQESCPERSLACELPGCANSVKVYHMKSHLLCMEHQHLLTQSIIESIRPTRRPVHNQNQHRDYQDLSDSANVAISIHDILSQDYAHLASRLNQRKTNITLNLSKFEELKTKGNDNDRKYTEINEKMVTIQDIVNKGKKIREEDQVLILDNNSTVTIRHNVPTAIPFSMTTMKFKTSEYGYAFLVRLCSKTIQDKEYLSIYLILYDDDYYNIIPFPFAYDIHITLLDQSPAKKHITHILESNVVSSSCTRPTRMHNDEFGINQFCSLQYLTNPESVYAKDGIFFIQIFIDFCNTKCNPL